MASVLDKYTSQFKNGKYVGKTTGADAVAKGNTVAVPSASQDYTPRIVSNPDPPRSDPPKNNNNNNGVYYSPDFEIHGDDDYEVENGLYEREDYSGNNSKNSKNSINYEDLYTKWKAEQDAQRRIEEENQKAAIEAGVKKAQNDLKSQKKTTTQNYADLYRQLYINKMNAQKGIDQQLAMMGQTGGQSESTLLGLNTDYADALRSGKISEQQAQAALDQAITDAGLSGDIQKAQALAQSATTAANNYGNAFLNLIGLAAQADQNRIEMVNNNAQSDRQYAYNIAMSLLGNGQMPSDETLATAGISKTDAMAIVAGNQKATGLGTKPSKDSTSGYPGQSNAYSIILNGSQNVAQNQGLGKALQYLEEQYSKNSDALTPYEKNNIAAILRQSY